MGLYIALKVSTSTSTSTTTFMESDVEFDLLSIVNGDLGLEFDTTLPYTDIEGILCVPVLYAQSETGATCDRITDLVTHGPPHIVIFGVSNNYQLRNSSLLGGDSVTFGLTNLGSPLWTNIAVIYDVTLCGGNGFKVKREGTGRTAQFTDSMLYHELSHALHQRDNTVETLPIMEEREATIDENDLRDVYGRPHRRLLSNGWVSNCGGGVAPCCIVASLATGSPFSEEIHRFRDLREQTLRSSEVGDDFFKEFFYQYYGFSPEVTRLMGHEPGLSSAIKKMFVMPLLAGVELLIYYADNNGTGSAEFMRRQAQREGLADIYEQKFLAELSAYLDFARNLDQKPLSLALRNKEKEFAGLDKLLDYVSKENRENEYINWSLTQVVNLWVESAILLDSDRPDAEIDLEIYEKIVAWIALMPISDIWRNFSRIQTELELKSLEQFIFDPRSKAVFAKRLLKKHPAYTETIQAWATER